MKTTWFLGISFKNFRNHSSHIFPALPFFLGLCFCHLLCGGSSPPVRRSLGSSWALFMWESLSRRIKFQELALIKQNLQLFRDLEDRNVHIFFWNDEQAQVFQIIGKWCGILVLIWRTKSGAEPPYSQWRSRRSGGDHYSGTSPVLFKEVHHCLGMSPLAFACLWRKSSL